MKLPAHLMQVSGVYYYRQSIPKSLRSLYSLREIRISLGTRDTQAAKLLSYALSAHFAAILSNPMNPDEFKKCQRRLKTDPLPVQVAEVKLTQGHAHSMVVAAGRWTCPALRLSLRR